MKKIVKLITLISSIAILMFSSCTPDDNSTGDDRDRLTGSWTCKDSSKSTGNVEPLYSVNITKAGDPDSIRIYNFYNLGGNTSIVALVSGTSIVIPTQTDDSYVMSGSGIYSNSSFNLNYTATLGTSTDNGIARYSR